jgi:hypothetical protein
VGHCRGVRRGYTGVVLKGGGVQEEGVGGCGWAGVAYRCMEYKVSVKICLPVSRPGCVAQSC